jgi:hypothetical protein
VIYYTCLASFILKKIKPGAPHAPPQKTLKNCKIKMQLNTKIEDPFPDFLKTPCTPSKEFENACASMNKTKVHI